MTEQRRREICAELARRMGWTGVEVGIDHYFFVGHPPNEPISSQRTYVPDPFTNAADKDALVAWICANDYKSAFGDELLKALGIRDKFLGDRFPAEFHIADILNAPREVITLAAAKALSILVDDPPGQA